MVERERGPQSDVEDAAAGGLQRIGEGDVAARTESLRPRDEAGARDQPDEHAPQRTDPVIVDGQLDEPRHADEHGEDADAIEPLRADAALHRETVALRGRFKGREPRWFDRPWRECGRGNGSLRRGRGQGRRRSFEGLPLHGLGRFSLFSNAVRLEQTFEAQKTIAQACHLLFETAGNEWVHCPTTLHHNLCHCQCRAVLIEVPVCTEGAASVRCLQPASHAFAEPIGTAANVPQVPQNGSLEGVSARLPAFSHA